MSTNRVRLTRIAVLFSFILLLAWSVMAMDGGQEEQPRTTRATIAAVGDVLMHLTLVKGAYNPASKGYEFAPMFAPVAPYLSGADYTLANLETKLAGQRYGYTGYPCFNSPVALAYALKGAGVDLVGTANNHCMDKGAAGLVSTLDNLDMVGLPHIGTYRSENEQETPFIVDIKGIKVAFINYTASTNGIPVPKAKKFSVNMLDVKDALEETKRARWLGAEIVIAFLHFGAEYQRKPNTEQKQIAEKLLEGGVDAIIGAHPHVVQPIEKVTVKRPDGPYTGIVAYSLGNFVSNQRERYRDSGIILYLLLEKDAQGARVTGVTFLPVWVQKRDVGGTALYRALPCSPEIKAVSDLELSKGDKKRMSEVWEELDAHLTDKKADILPLKLEATK